MSKQNNATIFEDPFSEEIWRSTYKDHKDTCVDDTFRRVAKALASVEATEELKVEWEDKFFDMLQGFKVVPGGRILANAGAGWKGTSLINCFVAPNEEYDMDSLQGILTHLYRQAATLKSEGGWGSSFNFCRPRGSFIHGVGVETPGAVKYMELFDKSSDIITAGSGRKSKNPMAKGKIRKGAMMGTLSCFDKDTLILTDTGYLPIKELVDHRSPRKAVTEDGEYDIIAWIKNPPQELFEVEDELGNKVIVTADHEFQVYNIETKKEYLKPLSSINNEIELLVRLAEV